jgi:glutathione synthase/RimK-type ligase-like ATP-grasp enzyme
MTQDVALVTCRSLPLLEEDDLPLVSALAELGCAAVPVLWDDPAVRWRHFEAVVLRSPVDYVERLAEFLRWAASVERLHNSFPMVRWNTDKAYLKALQAAGAAVVPTQWLAPGEPLTEPPDGAFVVKPCVGVGGGGVGRYDERELSRGTRHIRRLHDAGQVVLVQPYLDSVEDSGEASLVYFDGTYSHAVRRTGFLQIGGVIETGYKPSVGERELADRVVGLVTGLFGAPLYARVDLLAAPEGPAVNEVEVTDPVLHLRGEPAAAGRFARAVVEHLA